MRMPVQRFNFIDTARDNLVAKFKGASLSLPRLLLGCVLCCARVCARVLGLLSTADARRHRTASALTAVNAQCHLRRCAARVCAHTRGSNPR